MTETVTEFCRYCVSIMQGPVCHSRKQARTCPCYATEQRNDRERRQAHEDLLKTLGVKE